MCSQPSAGAIASHPCFLQSKGQYSSVWTLAHSLQQSQLYWMPEESLEQVIKNTAMTRIATAFQSMLSQTNQTKQTKKQSPLFSLLYGQVFLQMHRELDGGSDHRKASHQRQVIFIWISPPAWFTISQHSIRHNSWWQAAFSSTNYHLKCI